MSHRTSTPHRAINTIFADEFQQGRRYSVWRPDGTSDWLLIFTVEGSGLIGSGEVEEPSRKNELYLFAPGTPQSYRTNPEAGKWRLAWSHFQPHPHWLPWIEAWYRMAPGLHRCRMKPDSAAKQALESLRSAMRFIRQRIPQQEDFARNALETCLLWSALGATDSEWQRTDPRIRKGLEFLSQHIEATVSVEKLAMHCGLSPSRFAHLFRKETGTTPQRYGESLKMERARQLLLRTSSSISEIATLCGFDDPFYFSKRFSKFFGKSPRALREDSQPKGTTH